MFLLTRFKLLSFNVEVRQNRHVLKMHRNDSDKYLHEFHELGLQVPNMGDADSIYMFFQGLPGEVKAEIMYKGCATLQAAIEVATAFHQAHYSAKYRAAYESTGVASGYSDRSVDRSPMELDSVQPGQAEREWKKPEARSSQTQKCYRCQKNGHRALECRAEKPIPSQQQQGKPGG